MTKKPLLRFHLGTLLNPLSDLECELVREGVLAVDARTGKIHGIHDLAGARARYGKVFGGRAVIDHGSALLIPGFFDLHFHWVQDEVRVMPKASLLTWLKKYTFPTEMRFADPAYSRKRAKEFFLKLRGSGTQGGAIYSSIHETAIRSAFREVKGHFVIGNVLMNMESPPELTVGEEESLRLVRKLLKQYGTRYALTPRFAITTTPKVMKEGARLADTARAFKQTHLSETPGEIEFVLSQYRKIPGFEKVRTYTEIYQKAGMLGPRSIMGHGIHLSAAELRLLARTRTAIAHCPTSNAPVKDLGLGSGLFDFRRTEKAGVRWALGSDIGGGPFLSMFDVMESFVRQNRKADVKGATRVKALFRATLAGAAILGLDRITGNFKASKEANFMVVPVSDRVLAGRNAEEILERLHAGVRRRSAFDTLVASSWIKGRCVSRARSPGPAGA